MRNPKNVLNSLSKHSGNSNYKFERLYRVLFNAEMFYVAYERIYAKPGNMTAGTDGKTVSGMSIERIEQLIESLKNETYQPAPSKRAYIPKKNGKKRPLGIPSFNDKLVQEVVRMILEAHLYSDTVDAIDEGSVLDELQVIVDKMPPGMKEVFRLRVTEDYKFKEIAEKLGISENSAKVQMNGAIRMIREKLPYLKDRLLLFALF